MKPAAIEKLLFKVVKIRASLICQKKIVVFETTNNILFLWFTLSIVIVEKKYSFYLNLHYSASLILLCFWNVLHYLEKNTPINFFNLK